MPVIVSSVPAEQRHKSYHTDCCSSTPSSSEKGSWKASISSLDNQLNSLEGELMVKDDPADEVADRRRHHESRETGWVSVVNKSSKEVERRINKDLGSGREGH